jgi:hypothetical protein
VPDIAQERSRRPAVADDVVHHDHQHVLVRAGDEQRHAHQRPGAGQVEDVVRGLVYRCRHAVGFTLGDLQFQTGFLGGQYALVGLSPDVGEHRPQGLVPVEDIVQGGSHRPAVQRPPQAQRSRDVVGLVGTFQLVQEPQPPLRERQRDHRVSSGQRRIGHGA